MRALVACFIVASGTVAVAQVVPREAPPSRVAEAQPRTPTVICGTRVFSADPSIDPKFIKAAPRGRFTLRTLQPPVCRDTVSPPSAELKRRLPQFFGPKR